MTYLMEMQNLSTCVRFPVRAFPDVLQNNPLTRNVCCWYCLGGKSRAREWGQGCGSQLVHACPGNRDSAASAPMWPEVQAAPHQAWGAEAAMMPRGQDRLVQSWWGEGYSSPALLPPLVPICPILQPCRSSCRLCGKSSENSSEKKAVWGSYWGAGSITLPLPNALAVSSLALAPG